VRGATGRCEKRSFWNSKKLHFAKEGEELGREERGERGAERAGETTGQRTGAGIRQEERSFLERTEERYGDARNGIFEMRKIYTLQRKVKSSGGKRAASGERRGDVRRQERGEVRGWERRREAGRRREKRG
jgi:hypothetical protein